MMNNKVIYRVISLAIAFFIIPVIAMSQASPAQTPSKKTAKKWIKNQMRQFSTSIQFNGKNVLEVLP